MGGWGWGQAGGATILFPLVSPPTSLPLTMTLSGGTGWTQTRANHIAALHSAGEEWVLQSPWWQMVQFDTDFYKAGTFLIYHFFFFLFSFFYFGSLRCIAASLLLKDVECVCVCVCVCVFFFFFFNAQHSTSGSRRSLCVTSWVPS